MDICKDKKKCCCFTGHRPHKLGVAEENVKKLLSEAIDKMIIKGYTTFITGMAPGVDMWAAELVIEKRNENPNIFLVCASPYDGFEKKWKETEREKYRKIIKTADKVEYINKHYTPYCFALRNNWMVNNSSLVIAAYNYSGGGTKQTVEYALKKSVDVYNIFTDK